MQWFHKVFHSQELGVIGAFVLHKQPFVEKGTKYLKGWFEIPYIVCNQNTWHIVKQGD
jgi:hypothetical protein